MRIALLLTVLTFAVPLHAQSVTLGGEVTFEGEIFAVAGVFEAAGTVMESEVWFDRTDLMTIVQRDSLSCVVVRLENLDGFADADLFSKQRLDLELVAMRESDYYTKLSQFYRPGEA